MPIINTVSSQDAAEKEIAALAAAGIPAGNLRDISDSWRPNLCDYWTEDKRAAFQLWAYDSYIGLCLDDREMNGYDDSDFYMMVYEPSSDSFHEIMFATTRGWTYPSYGSKPDAPPELKAKFDAHLAALYKAAHERKELEEIMTPEPGKRLQVIKGRKAVGVEGICIWAGHFKRGFSRWADSAFRVGIKTDDGQVHFIDAKNVQVV